MIPFRAFLCKSSDGGTSFSFLLSNDADRRESRRLQRAVGQQNALSAGQKLNAQFGGLVVGTQKLAQEGNKSAQTIVERLKQLGVIPPEQPAAASPAPVPAAREVPSSGPVKP
jgi:alkyl hydroperoxide reductase subunit AhpF